MAKKKRKPSKFDAEKTARELSPLLRDAVSIANELAHHSGGGVERSILNKLEMAVELVDHHLLESDGEEE